VAEPTYEQGLKEGRVNALLEEHTARLNKINGSVERHAKSVETLAKQMSVGFEKVASEMRTMQEEARARELAVQVAATTLAEETERRRVEEERLREERADALSEQPRTWSLRANKVSASAGITSIALAVATVYLALH
jgi:hypothetical protein